MGNKPLKIFSHSVTPRLEYAAEVIFSNILGIDFEITTDRRRIGNSPAVIYADESAPGSVVIKPDGLLFSEGVTPLVPSVDHIGDMPVLFRSSAGFFPFDVFSAVFYMVTRYEEYLPFAPDAHGRFKGASSLSYKNGFLHLPVADMWAKYLAAEIVKKYPVITIRHNEYRPLLTVDVDQPFAYRSRGFLRSVGGFVRGITSGGPAATERLRTVMGKESDPYDTFGYIDEVAGRNETPRLFFFPTGDHGEYDRNPSYRDHEYGEIVRHYDSLCGTGIHPSYHSFGRQCVLATEAGRYTHITGHAPDKARQHWLLLRMPDTYRDMEATGIKYDYTMGFADEPGFRAGIARPYKFYDLGAERTTSLTVVPFQVMDGTLRQYRNMSADNAIETIRELIDVTRKAGGLFISVWHNTSLTEREGWEGWRKVFEETLAYQK